MPVYACEPDILYKIPWYNIKCGTINVVLGLEDLNKSCKIAPKGLSTKIKHLN